MTLMTPPVRPAVLGVVAAGDDLGLLDELVGQVGGQQAKARVGRVDTLDDVRVLDRGRAAQRRAVEVVLRSAGRPEHRAEGTAGRDVLGVVAGDCVAGLGRVLIDERRAPLDHDRLTGLRLCVDVDVDLGDLAQLDEHVGARELGVGVIDDDLVRAGRQVGDAVLPGLVGDGGLGALHGGTGRHHGGADDRLAVGLIADLSANGSGGGVLRIRRADGAEEQASHRKYRCSVVESHWFYSCSCS